MYLIITEVCVVKKCVKEEKYKCGARSATLAWSVFLLKEESRASWKMESIRVVRKRERVVIKNQLCLKSLFESLICSLLLFIV